MKKRKLIITVFTLLALIIGGYFFIPRSINLSQGKKQILLVISSADFKFEAGNVKPDIETENYELPADNEKVNELLKGIKFYSTTIGLFKKNSFIFDDINYTISIYIYDEASQKMTNLDIMSEGYVVYSDINANKIMSLGFYRKDKFAKIKKALEDLIKSEGIEKK